MSTTVKKQLPIFIDIGSHKGEEINWALEHDYQVHAFEPNPRMKPYLQKYEPSIRMNYAAAWNADGKVRLYEKNMDWDNDQGLSVMEDKTNINKNDYIEVPSVNIGRYLEELDRDIDVLKIDAEGAEYVILESILARFDFKRIKKVFVEDHEGLIFNWHDHKKRVLDKLKSKLVTLEEWQGANGIKL